MDTTEINRILDHQVRDHKTPSLQYRLFSREAVLHSYTNGMADVKNGIPATDITSYHAFSITKTFTAIAILQLAEQKKLDVDQPVKNFLMSIPYTEPITIKQLLTHSAGIPNPVPLSWIHLAGDHQSFDTRNFFKKVLLKNSKLKSDPNIKFAYSNLGYVLLGEIIEKVSGLSFENYIRQHILKPLNITPEKLDFLIPDTTHHAKGYHRKNSLSYFLLDFFINTGKYMDETEGKWKPFRNNYVNGAAYGGLIGRADALVIYAKELLQHEPVLLTNASMQLMLTENKTTRGKATGMCMSWFTGTLHGHNFYTHAGGGGGYYCEIRIYPGIGIGSVIMFNRTGMTDERFLDKIDKWVIPQMEKATAY